MTGRIAKGRDHLWRMMREQSRDGGTFTVSSLMKAQNGHRKRFVLAWLHTCRDAAVVEAVGSERLPNGVERLFWRVVAGASQPVTTTKRCTAQAARQNMWNALRATSGWMTVRQLVVAASTDTLRITETVGRTYIKTLAESGYVHRAKNLRGTPMYRLSRLYDTGPLAPGPLNGVFFDFNTGVNVTTSSIGRAA
jgi:hypothetical protein